MSKNQGQIHRKFVYFFPLKWCCVCFSRIHAFVELFLHNPLGYYNFDNSHLWLNSLRAKTFENGKFVDHINLIHYILELDDYIFFESAFIHLHLDLFRLWWTSLPKLFLLFAHFIFIGKSNRCRYQACKYQGSPIVWKFSVESVSVLSNSRGQV